MTMHPFRITDTQIKLPKTGARQQAHVFSEDEKLIVEMALVTGRPLLVRGEPGAGKSQLARAAAIALKRAFVSAVVDARTEATDLQWRYDRVARLAAAQVLGALQGKMDLDAINDELSPNRFLTPGPLWWALSWKDAAGDGYAPGVTPPEIPEGCDPANGVVVLIDEIDKGDGAVPSGLLAVLGDGAFAIPGGERIVRDKEAPPPLIVITTNEDRQLPPAFVRRCLVLHIELDDNDIAVLTQWLLVRGRAHFPDASDALLREAAARVCAVRAQARSVGVCPPGLAEYIDLLHAVHEWQGLKDDAARIEQLRRLASFALAKHQELTSLRRQEVADEPAGEDRAGMASAAGAGPAADDGSGGA